MAKRAYTPSSKASKEPTAEQGFEKEDIKETLETERIIARWEPETADTRLSSKPDDRENRILNGKISLKPAKLGKHILDVLPDLPDIRDPFAHVREVSIRRLHSRFAIKDRHLPVPVSRLHM
jgi:hypothetical protein